MGAKGVYGRKKGLDLDTNKSLLRRRAERNKVVGARMEAFRQVLPALARSEIQVLLCELAAEQVVPMRGVTWAARWYPRPRLAD